MQLNTFLKGGGETGSLIRMTDWAQTSLGAIDQWSQSLNTTLSIIVNSKWPDETILGIRASGNSQYDKDNTPISIVGVTFDITEHKNLQQQKDQFIGIASHELKTPVTSIKASAQILEKI